MMITREEHPQDTRAHQFMHCVACEWDECEGDMVMVGLMR